MKLFTICLSLSLLTPFVFANKLAGPYTSVFYWYAYRMDILANGIENSIIAKDIPGSRVPRTGPGGTYYFDEFLKAIQVTNKKTPRKVWTGSSGVGHDLNPDVVTAAQGISASGEGSKVPTDKYSNTINPSKLIPSKWDAQEVAAKSPDFTEVVQTVVDYVQQCRQKVGDAMVATELNGVREAMTGLHTARVADEADKRLKLVEKWIRQDGFSWTPETTEKTGMGGALKWTEIDTEATISAHPEAGDGLKAAISDNLNKYLESSDSENRRAEHYKAMQSAQVFESRLHGPPDC